MHPAVEHDVLVNLVGYEQAVGIAHDSGERVEIVGCQDCARRVVRKIQHEEPGLRIDGLGDALPVGVEVVAVGVDLQRDPSRHAAGEPYGGFVRIVRRVEDDHFVARAHDGRNGTEQTLCGSRAHRNFAIDIQRAPLEVLVLVGDSLPQGRRTRHRRVLVGPVANVPVDAVDQGFGRFEPREPLREINGPGLGGQLAHDRENGRADIGQFARDCACHATESKRYAGPAGSGAAYWCILIARQQ